MFKLIEISNREEISSLEKELEDKGWTDLKWGPHWRNDSGAPDKTHEGLILAWQLYVRPPNYTGPYSDPDDVAMITLKDEVPCGKVVGVLLRAENGNYDEGGFKRS